ncbi:hypothetical protein GCM10009555_006000 [Acrocarpospora macrocephala]|uniref:Uncharacterized protein n=1 Tax=Acrocarpospora macrocephala TaxID=150177 RepID=A0A5M3X7F0_9ACTN|nr:hypothetical protein Amac_083900 [Acrocarpospora macrocephala]
MLAAAMPISDQSAGALAPVGLPGTHRVSSSSSDSAPAMRRIRAEAQKREVPGFLAVARHLS